MNYAIRKRRPDHRKHTCGFKTPDGVVVVEELTLYNADRFIKVLYHGYIVEETMLDPGVYREEQYALFGGDALDLVKLGLVNAVTNSISAEKAYV